MYRPVSACGPIRVGGERTRPVREWEGLTRRPTLFVSALDSQHVYFFLRSGRCVSADAAAVFAALLELLLRSTLLAALAARALVTSEFDFLPAILIHLLSTGCEFSRDMSGTTQGKIGTLLLR